MVQTTSEIEDTDYDIFTPNLSPVSSGSNDSSDMLNKEEDRKFAFNDTSSLLGVIVDRSSFDEDDELTTYGRDGPSVFQRYPNLPQHQQLDLGLPLGAVVMKNGKVRRKMRWKPRFGKKKSLSSNASVVSALTNRSSGTMRSASTTRSFLSHFSRKSNTSFHTFNSTETPVATNRANRPQAPHTVMRPNYQDSFDPKAPSSRPKYSTIDTEGKFMNRQRMGGSSKFGVSSASGFPSTKLDSVIESSISEDVEVNRSSSLSSSDRAGPNSIASGTQLPDFKTKAIEAINFSTSSNNSVGSKSTISALSKGAPTKPPIPSTIKGSKSSSQQLSKPRLPPLFKRRLRHNKNKNLSNLNTNSMSHISQNVSSPTDTNSTASLSTAISLERENSGLPVLLGDEQDRRVQIDINSSLSSTDDSPTESQRTLDVNKTEDEAVAEEGPEENSVSPTVQSIVSESPSGGQSSQSASASSSMLSRNTTPTSLQKRISSISKKRSTSSTSVSTASPNRGSVSSASPKRGGGSSAGGSTGTTPPSATASSATTKGKLGSSIPNLDEGAFMEAEHNLRAIHDMAAEHLAHGEFEEAADVFEEILRGQQERYGQDHYRVGTALHNLGIVYLKKGDYNKAIEICRRAVDVRKDSLVPNHPDVAVSLAQLGVAHLESRNFREALAAFRDALNIRRNFLGPRHMKCSKILNNIGCALYSIEDLSASKRAFDEALWIQREGLRSLPSIEGSGNDSNGMQSNTLLLSMASTLCNIGSIRLRWGDFEKAGIALEEALLIQQSVLGDEHPIVSSTIDSIQLVEAAANPLSHHALLMKQAAAACAAAEPAEVVNEIIETFEDISPKNWFANPCGPVAYNPKDDQ